MLLLFILSIVYRVLTGMEQAVLYSKKAYEAFRWDEHYLTIGRRVVFIIFLIALPLIGKNSDFAVETMVALVLSFIVGFSFWHDSIYYEMRKYIEGGNVYPDGYKSEADKKQTIPVIGKSFTWRTRKIMGIAELVIIVIYFIEKHAHFLEKL